MPIKPGSSPVAYLSTSPSCSGTVYVDSVDFTEVIQNFDRLEFSNVKLREAKTSTGALPLIVTTFGNNPLQLISSCTGDVPRPLVPDDSNIPYIKQQFQILRYQIKGAACLAADVDNLLTVYQSHLILMDSFHLYLEELQMELSILYIEGLQSYSLNYLSTPGFSLSGAAMQGTESNLLITEFDAGVAYEAPVPGNPSQSNVYCDFTMTCGNYNIVSRHL